MVEGARLAHGDAEVVVTEPQHVDARQGRDLVGRGGAARVLDLQDDGGARVLFGKARQQRFGAPGEALVGEAQRHAACAVGPVLGGVEHGPGLLDRRDDGDHYAVGAGVERARDVMT